MTTIIGEIGINANGSVDIAKQLMDMAKECGADMVKFQKRTINVVYTNLTSAAARSAYHASITDRPPTTGCGGPTTKKGRESSLTAPGIPCTADGSTVFDHLVWQELTFASPA